MFYAFLSLSVPGVSPSLNLSQLTADIAQVLPFVCSSKASGYASFRLLLPVDLYRELYEQIIASDALLNWEHSVAKCPAFVPSAISPNFSKDGHNPQHPSEGLVTCGSTTPKESNREYPMHTEITHEQGL